LTGTQLAAKIRKYTGTNSTTYTDAVMLPDVNDVKNDLASAITQRNEQLFVIPATDALVASSVTAREYSLPDDLLNHILTVEAALDTNQSTVFVPVLPYPGGLQRAYRNLNGLTEAKIVNLFTNQQPYYYLTRRGIYILSGTISALSGGLKIRYRLYPADLANVTGSTGLHIDPTTSSFGMPLQFHELWARKVSITWKNSRTKPIPLSPLEINYPNDLKDALDAISDDDRSKEEIGSLPVEDSSAVLGANV